MGTRPLSESFRAQRRNGSRSAGSARAARDRLARSEGREPGARTPAEGSSMPTGVALRDVREQLFDAAERVLLRDGAGALTSRAITTEAGVAKGVLHRHFADFDAFLAELVLDRAGRVGGEAAALRDRAGTGSVTGHVAAALTALFSSVALEIVALLTFRDGLRARLRAAGAAGSPELTEATAMT